MYKISPFLIAFILVPFLIPTISLNSYASDKPNIKYPFALIGTDQAGILSEEDLASGACTAPPVLFSHQNTYTAYPYWSCFEAKHLTIVCDDAGFEESLKERMAILVVAIRDHGEKNEYLSRKAITIKSCRIYQRELQNITKGQTHVCISGPFNNYETGPLGKKVGYWIFDKVKTLKGCVSYFEGACSLPYLIKSGCTLDN